ncbi:glycerophosphodiester phosphodiesterase family protein [Aquipuribacter hungaricus]|uniref:Glycerophosphodiester phosphodiesterase family protein n=1 Tax=Aquipuribacter hungaricus TaxID=545624 RepID=A0ABV7WD46_9MICO
MTSPTGSRPPHPALRGTPLGFAHRGWTPLSAGGSEPDGPPDRTPDGTPDGKPAEAAPHRHVWENTLEAFAAALELGLTHLETDVQATADGVAVVLHDPDLARTTGRAVPVQAMTWAELAGVRVAGLHPVPRVEAVLEAFPGAVLNIDVKDARAVRALADAVRRAGAEDRTVVASFDGRRSRAVQLLAPGVARSAGMAASAGARLAAALERLSAPLGRSLLVRAAGGADALQVPEHAGRLRVVTPRLLRLAHDVGLQVHVWTVDDAGDMDRLLDLGVDGLMSDRADLLSQVLSRRAG